MKFDRIERKYCTTCPSKDDQMYKTDYININLLMLSYDKGGLLLINYWFWYEEIKTTWEFENKVFLTEVHSEIKLLKKILHCIKFLTPIYHFPQLPTKMIQDLLYSNSWKLQSGIIGIFQGSEATEKVYI